MAVHILVILLSFTLHSLDDLTLSGAIFDAAGAPLSDAHIVLLNTTDQTRWETVTPANGSYRFDKLPEGSYSIEISKDAFFTFKTDIKLDATTSLEFTLSPVEAVKEHVEVVARSEPISTDTVSSQQSVNEAAIQSLPYSGSRNFLNALDLMPDVLEDNTGQVHIEGSRADQIRYQLDGINITSPSGGLAANVPIDAIESVNLDLSGYSAELGNGSGGVVRVQSQFIGDKLRWNTTDFVPTFSFKQRTISDFSPRLFVAGPVVQRKAWFMYSASLHFRRTFNESLPLNANRQNQTLGDQLGKVQWNLAESHVLTFSILNNNESDGNVGLSTLRPLETTTNNLRRGTTAAISNRSIVNGVVLESAVQWTHRRDTDLAKGDVELIISPAGWTGNYFADRVGHDDRLHLAHTVAWETKAGNIVHRFKAGVEFDDVNSYLLLNQRPYEVLDSTGALELAIQFDGPNMARVINRQVGTFFQDRIVLSHSTQIELGARTDRESITGQTNLAPRLAASYFPFENGHTKISGGVGFFFDNVPIQDLELAQLQVRTATAYVDGVPTQTAGATAVLVSPLLESPYGVHWNAQWEQEWIPRWVSRINLIEKRGHDQVRLGLDPLPGGADDLIFNNSGKSTYKAVELTFDHPVRIDSHIFASYIYSESLARPSLSMNFPDPAVEQIGLAPTSWNARQRFISWGYFPFLKKYNAAYALDAHSGFPFSVIDEVGRLQGTYDAYHYPVYLNANISIERVLPVLFGKHLAIRIGINNLSDHFNPRFVDNDINSPTFMSYSNSTSRGFAFRLRALQN